MKPCWCCPNWIVESESRLVKRKHLGCSDFCDLRTYVSAPKEAICVEYDVAMTSGLRSGLVARNEEMKFDEMRSLRIDGEKMKVFTIFSFVNK